MKKTLSFILCLLLIVSYSVGAFASPSQPPKVVDEADLLTEQQKAELTERAEEIAQTYAMDVVIVTVNTTGGYDAQIYADDFFDYNGYGIGSRYSGVLFLIAMDERDWHVSTCGDAIDAFHSRALKETRDDVVTYLSRGEYDTAFHCWLSIVEKYYEAYTTGDTAVYKSEPDYAKTVLISVVIGFVAALIALLILVSTMRTARAKTNATDYLRRGSYQVTMHRDLFLYSRVRKTERSSESGGNSTHHSSSGRNHGGGGGKF